MCATIANNCGHPFCRHFWFLFWGQRRSECRLCCHRIWLGWCEWFLCVNWQVLAWVTCLWERQRMLDLQRTPQESQVWADWLWVDTWPTRQASVPFSFAKLHHGIIYFPTIWCKTSFHHCKPETLLPRPYQLSQEHITYFQSTPYMETH